MKAKGPSPRPLPIEAALTSALEFSAGTSDLHCLGRTIWIRMLIIIITTTTIIVITISSINRYLRTSVWVVYYLRCTRPCEAFPTTLYDAIPRVFCRSSHYSGIRSGAGPRCCVVLCHAVICYAMPWCGVIRSVQLCHAIMCHGCAMLGYAMACDANANAKADDMLFCAVLCYARLRSMLTLRKG